MKIFVEHALYVARIVSNTGLIDRCVVQRASYEHWFINKRMVALKKPVGWRETRLISTDVWAAEAELPLLQRCEKIQTEPPFLLVDQ